MEEAKKEPEVAEEVIEEIVVAQSDNKMIFSETIGELATALSKAQGEMKGVEKSKQGYGYKFADLGAVLDTLREPFAKNGLAIVQGHELKKGKNPSVVTYSRIIHSSGEWTESALEIPIAQMKGLSPAQMIGVVCTYAKRYLIQAQAGLASEDTDGTVKK